MSRIGKKSIIVPEGFEVSFKENSISFHKDKIKKSYQIYPGVSLSNDSGQIKLFPSDKKIPGISMYVGMSRSNISNIVKGLQSVFNITLEINGVGYKSSVESGMLSLSLGYSHDIFYYIPSEVKIVTEKPNLIIVSGSDKAMVGRVASEIMLFRKTEPYKGKGVKILGDFILRKEGKKK